MQVRIILKSGDESESMGRVGIEKASGMQKIGVPGFGEDQSDYEVVDTGHDTSGITFGHTGAVFS